MLSHEFLSRLENAKRDLSVVETGQYFRNFSRDQAFKSAYLEAKNLALEWLPRVERAMNKLDNEAAAQPLALFIESIVRVADGQQVTSGQNLPNEIRRLMGVFNGSLPLLIYVLLEAYGITRLSDEDFVAKRAKALQEIGEAAQAAQNIILKDADGQRGHIVEVVDAATGNIRKTVEDAQRDLDRIKTEASRISVEKALEQFSEAARSLRSKAWWWGIVTGLLFACLLGFLLWFFRNPPTIIRQIMDSWKPGATAVAPPVSIPLLIAASAYFTSIRLAVIGILGVGLAFSLKMTRAYLHMIEHNHHKLRVTNSIEAFVAALRTPDYTDLVLSKLVESVTDFGDSGILGQQNEASVIMGAMTKNVGKSE